MEHEDLTQQLIGCAISVHRALGSGYLESVYQAALTHEFTKTRLPFERERRLRVTYDGVVVGDFIADFVVSHTILVEIKSVLTLGVAHEIQLVNYLTATGLDIGLLINFGTDRVQTKRKHRLYAPTTVHRPT
jgi:GxxExxY protein